MYAHTREARSRGMQASGSVHKHKQADACLYTPLAHPPAVFSARPMRQRGLLGASSNYSRLEVTSGSATLLLYVSVSGAREAGRERRHQEHVRAHRRGMALYSITTTALGSGALSSAAPVVHQATLAGYEL